MAVAAELAQQGQRVPQHQVGVVGPLEVEVGGEQHQARGRAGLGRAAGEVGGLAYLGARQSGVVGDGGPQRAVGTRQAGRVAAGDPRFWVLVCVAGNTGVYPEGSMRASDAMMAG